MDIQEIGFGDFCTIEQKRYVGPNEFYGYKVVGRKKSNAWTDVPVDARNSKETLHDHSDDVVTVICNNLDDRTVHQFRVSDLASVRKAQTVPEGFIFCSLEVFKHQQAKIDDLMAQLNNMESCYIEKKKQVDAVEHVLGCAMIGPKEVFMYAERIQEALQGGDQNTKNKAQCIENIGHEGGDQKAMIEAQEQNR